MYKKIISTIVEEQFDEVPDEVSESDNDIDVIKINSLLMIRLLEYAREEALSDVDLHIIVEKLLELCSEGDILKMKNYEDIIMSSSTKD